MIVTFGADPALRSPGLAIGIDGVIVAADTLVMSKLVNALPFGERVDRIAELCVAWFHARAWTGPGGGLDGGSHWYRDVPVRVVYEKPQIYGGPQPGDANDLLAIGMVAASIATRMRLRGATIVDPPTPREWTHGTKKLKKNVAELWLEQRGAMIARRLKPAERAVVPDKHDAVDAVGLVLHADGRLEPIRVNARPTSAFAKPR